jgi:hypothetical protein
MLLTHTAVNRKKVNSFTFGLHTADFGHFIPVLGQFGRFQYLPTKPICEILLHSP